MTRRRSASPPRTSARTTLERLLADEGLEPTALRLRLAAIDQAQGRAALVAMCAEGKLDIDDFELLIEAVRAFGPGPEYAALGDVALDRDRDEVLRGLALALLGTVDPQAIEQVVTRLPPVEALRLSSQPLLSLVHHAEVASAAAAALARSLTEMPPEMLDATLGLLEERRRALGAPAVLVYRQALGRTAPASLRRRLLDIVVAEDPPAATYCLEALRDEARDDETRQALQSALMRLGTRALSDDNTAAPRAPQGHAVVTTCDGQGAYSIFSWFERAGGSNTLANVCIRAGRDVRDGFLLLALKRSEIDELIRSYCEGAGVDVAPVPLGEVASLVLRAAERTRALGKTIPTDAEAPLLRLSGLARAPAPAPAAPKRASRARTVKDGSPEKSAKPDSDARLPSVDEVRAALAGRVFGSWFWDIGDLAGSPVEPPKRRRPAARWYDEALRGLAGTELNDRLVAMAEHTARWHGWHGDAVAATRFAQLAEATRRDFATSPLARVVLERSLPAISAGAAPLPPIEHGAMPRFGDPVERELIRRALFPDVETATGMDLARLDFTEVADAVLLDAADMLAGHLRPREQERRQAALAIASVFVDAAVGHRRLDEQLGRDMASALARALSLPSTEGLMLAAEVAPVLGTFVEDVCRRCPVGCLERPEAELPAAFEADAHPALGRAAQRRRR